MQKISSFFTLLFLLQIIGVSAQHPEAMNVQTNIGADQSILLEKITNIEFEDDALVFITTSGNFQIMMDDIQNIVFGKYINGPTTNVADLKDNGIEMSIIGNILSIKSEYSINALYLMDITGKLLSSQKLSSVRETTIALPNSGICVVFLDTNQGFVARKIINN